MLRVIRALLTGTVALALLLTLGLTANATPVSGSWQNTPKTAGGKPGQQWWTLNQITRMVDQTPKGATITVSMYSQNRWNDRTQPGGSVLGHMAKAVKRGVHLRYVTFGQGNSAEFKKLAKAVKKKHDRYSWTKVCSGTCWGGAGINHLKALTFTTTGGRRNVSLIMSGNLTKSGAVQQWNNDQVLLDPVIFAAVTRHIVLMRNDRWQGKVKPIRHGALTLYLYPQPKKPDDPFLRELQHMNCTWKVHRKVGRKWKWVKAHGWVLVDIAFWSGNRNSYTRELGKKQRQGCNIRVVGTRYTDPHRPPLMSNAVLKQLRKDHIPTWDSAVRGKHGALRYSHNKGAAYYGCWAKCSTHRPRVAGETLTGSGNMTKAGQRSNDDAILLWKSTTVYQWRAAQWRNVAAHSKRIV